MPTRLARCLRKTGRFTGRRWSRVARSARRGFREIIDESPHARATSANSSASSGVFLVVDDALGPLGVRAVRAAVEGVVRLDAVADDLAAAVGADGRQLVDRALEAVERVGDSGGHDLKRHVIVVAAHFALGHGELLLM